MKRRRPTKRQVEALTKMLWRLEAWQQIATLDDGMSYQINRAKAILMDVERQLEAAREAKR